VVRGEQAVRIYAQSLDKIEKNGVHRLDIVKADSYND
jgi:hypothetical protein